MSTVVRLLGRASIEVAGRVWRPPADLRHAMLLYLAYGADWVPRDDLLYLFWPDADERRARTNLRQLLHAVRSLPYTGEVEVERSRVRWTVETDVASWRQALARRELPAPGHWPDGSLLDGFRLPQAPEFESWLELERASLFDSARTVVLGTADDASHDGRPEEALAVLDAWLQRAPLDEEAVRATMVVGNASGRRAAALARFASFELALSRELGLAPERDTLDLAAALRASRVQDVVTLRKGPSGTPRRPLRTGSPVHAIVGREAEMSRLEDALLAAGAPVVTLLAMGGMGKTRLAAEAVERLRPRFADGAAAVWLADADRADQLGSALVEALGFEPAPLRPLLEQVEAFLARRRMLVLLDNVEQLDGVAETLMRLRVAAPGVAWLLTSRTKIGVAGETVVDLQGLSFPSEADPLVRGRFAAVDLLLDLARRAGHELQLEQHGRDVVRLCRLTAGTPLALELASGWLRVLPIARIADELEMGIDVLEATDPHADPRHVSMRVVFEASWSALSAPERLALLAMATFRGGFDETAAREVAEVGRPMLLALRNKSFLSLDDTGRFHQHPLLEAFVRSKAEEDPAGLGRARERHARWFMAFLARWDDAAHSDHETQADRVLSREHANIEVAWSYALDAGMRDATWWEHLKRGGAPLGLSYLAVGRPLRWNELLRAALARVPQDSATWAVLEAHESSMAEFAGRCDEAYARRTHAVASLRRHDDPNSLAWASLLLAESARSLGRAEEANAALEESRRLFEQLHQDQLAGMVLHKLQESADDPDEKERYYRLGEEYRRRTGHGGQIVVARRDYADFIAHTHGEFAQAIALIDEAMPLAHRYGGAPVGEPLTLRLSAEIRLSAGQVESAHRLALEALARWPRFREVFPHVEAELVALSATAAYLEGDASAAAEAVAPDTAAGATFGGLSLRSAIAMAEGNLPRARDDADQAVRVAAVQTVGRAGHRRLTRALVTSAEVGLAEDDDARARSDLARALEIAACHRFLPLLLHVCAAAARLVPREDERQIRAWVAGHPAAESWVRRRLSGVSVMRSHPTDRSARWQEALAMADRVHVALDGWPGD